MERIELTAADVKEKMIAIVKFGPMTDSDGYKAGAFYQVTIDPALRTNGGFIRFGSNQADEILGWQMADKVFVCEILKVISDDIPSDIDLNETIKIDDYREVA